MTEQIEPTEQIPLADGLVRLSHLVQYVFADVSRENALTPQQTQLLCRLVSGPIGMAELGRSLHLEKSSLTGLVDRVEKRELVVRVRDPHDRRAYRIALTDDGSVLADTCHEHICRRLESLAGDVGGADGERVASLVLRMYAAYDGRTTHGR